MQESRGIFVVLLLRAEHKARGDGAEIQSENWVKRIPGHNRTACQSPVLIFQNDWRGAEPPQKNQ